MQPFSEIKIFWPIITDFLLKFFSPHFGRWGACHDIYDITKQAHQLAPKQMTDYKKFTAWPQNSTKTFIKRTISQKTSAYSLFYKLIFCNSSHKLHRIRFQSFLVLSNFAWFLYLVPNSAQNCRCLIFLVTTFNYEWQL